MPSVGSVGSMLSFFLFLMLSGEPGLLPDGRLFVMRHCREVDRRAFGGHKAEPGPQRRRREKEEKKKDDRRAAGKTRVGSNRSETRQEKRRRLQAPKARESSWLATAVPCCLWAGEERGEKGTKKNVWAMRAVFFSCFFSSLPVSRLFFLRGQFFSTAPPPPRPWKASGQGAPEGSPPGHCRRSVGGATLAVESLLVPQPITRLLVAAEAPKLSRPSMLLARRSINSMQLILDRHPMTLEGRLQ
ncbi:hypothetical protein J3F83DRAFT_671689 [Trichoderma novae-zelandiae]